MPTSKPIDSLTSNMGHCLWTGIVDAEKAARVADDLLSPEMFSGWGVRTLSTAMGGYNPISYHCGSVWPHDTAIVAAGLSRYGLTDHAQRIVSGLLEAAVHMGGRLPELFSGLDHPSSRPRSVTRRRVLPKHGQRRRRCCAFVSCSVSTPGCPTAKHGSPRACHRACTG